jgi:2-oxoglutarate dehydrogenase E1 component
MEHSRSEVEELTTGDFRLVLDDRARPQPATVERIVLCSGKLGHELMDARDETGAPVAVVRVEQLYPWPETELLVVLDRYPNVAEVCWVQEEPANMGAWNYVHGKLHRLLRGRAELRHVARRASASPASGSAKIHDHEQHDLIAAALDPTARPVVD